MGIMGQYDNMIDPVKPRISHDMTTSGIEASYNYVYNQET